MATTKKRTPSFLLVSMILGLMNVSINGTSLYTLDGYDNLAGQSAICWASTASVVGHHVNHPTQNVEHSSDVGALPNLITHTTTMLRKCPEGTDVHLEPPVPEPGDRYLRTGQIHQFKMAATVNMIAVRQKLGLTADQGLYPIAGRVVFCPPNGNLCSPFIVSQTKSAVEEASSHENNGGTHGDSGTDHLSYNDNDDDLNSTMGQLNREGDHDGIPSGHNIFNTSEDHIDHDDSYSRGNHSMMGNTTNYLSNPWESMNSTMGNFNSTADGMNTPHTDCYTMGDQFTTWNTSNFTNTSMPHVPSEDMNSTMGHSITSSDSMITTGHADMERTNDYSSIEGMNTTSHAGENTSTTGDAHTTIDPMNTTHDISHTESVNITNNTANMPSANATERLRRRAQRGEHGIDSPNSDDFVVGNSIVHGQSDLSILRLVNDSSPWQLQNISDDTNDAIVVVKMTFDVFITEPGLYLPLGVIQILLDDEVNSVTRKSTEFARLDIANLLHTSAIEFQLPAVIRSITFGVKTFAHIMIAIAGLAQLAFLFLTIKHRDESVMKMAQGRFLILLHFAALIATCCCFLYEPKTDVHCKLSEPLTLIPMQFMLAVIFGRLVRTTTLMGGLMNWNSHVSTSRLLVSRRNSFMSDATQDETFDPSGGGSQFLSRIRHCMLFCQQRKRPKNLRRTFSVKLLWGIILGLTVPQLITQTIGLIFFPPKLTIRLNENQTVGRYECANAGIPFYFMINVGLIFVTLLAAMYQANKSRNLPGLFNEARSVAMALFTTIGFSALAFMLIIATYGPGSPPDVKYLMIIVIILNFTLNLTIRVVLPKLKLIWKGEKVAVRNLISEHMSRNSRQRRDSSWGGSEINRSAIESPRYSFTDSIGLPSTSMDEASPEPRRPSSTFEDNDQPPHTSFTALTRVLMPTERAPDCRSSAEPEKEEVTVPGDNLADYIDELAESKPNKNAVVSKRRAIKASGFVLKEGCEPPKKLTLNIVSLNQVTARLNRRILSGLVVSNDDWATLRRQVDETNRLLKHSKIEGEEEPDEFDC